MVRALRAGCVAMLLVLAASSAIAQTDEIVFVNRTGATIYFLYASASTADNWGEDLLGRTVLPNEGIYRARLRLRAPSYDIRAVDANDNEYIIWGWRPDANRRVVIAPGAFVGATATAASTAALSWITIVNDTNYAIREIHVAPARARRWSSGEQYLVRGELVQPGEDYRIEVDAERYDTFLYDIMLVDEDGDRYIKRDVNLELTTQVVYTLDDLEWP